MTVKEVCEVSEMGGLFNSSLTILETEEPCRLLPSELKVWNQTDFLGTETAPEPLL